MKYAEDCQNVFGYFLHHFPYFGMRGEEDAADLKAASARMHELHLREFSEPLVTEAAWCAAAKPAWCAASKPAWCAAARPAAAHSAWCAAGKPAWCAAGKPAWCAAGARGLDATRRPQLPPAN
jgi:hypothetical protein